MFACDGQSGCGNRALVSTAMNVNSIFISGGLRWFVTANLQIWGSFLKTQDKLADLKTILLMSPVFFNRESFFY